MVALTPPFNIDCVWFFLVFVRLKWLLRLALLIRWFLNSFDFCRFCFDVTVQFSLWESGAGFFRMIYLFNFRIYNYFRCISRNSKWWIQIDAPRVLLREFVFIADWKMIIRIWIISFYTQCMKFKVRIICDHGNDRTWRKEICDRMFLILFLFFHIDTMTNELRWSDRIEISWLNSSKRNDISFSISGFFLPISLWVFGLS